MTNEKRSTSRDKKTYRRPRLTAYGDVRAITQTIANNGNSDNRPRRAGGPQNTSEVA